MDDKERKVKREEILHGLIKKHDKGIGEVDASEVAALGKIIRRRAGDKGIEKLTPREIVEMQRATLSDTGADPTRAERQIKERQEYERKLRAWERRNRGR